MQIYEPKIRLKNIEHPSIDWCRKPPIVKYTVKVAWLDTKHCYINIEFPSRCVFQYQYKKFFAKSLKPNKRTRCKLVEKILDDERFSVSFITKMQRDLINILQRLWCSRKKFPKAFLLCTHFMPYHLVMKVLYKWKLLLQLLGHDHQKWFQWKNVQPSCERDINCCSCV